MEKLTSIMTIIFLAGGMIVSTPTIHAQTTWYVDDDAPADPGPGDPDMSDPLEDGSSGHPFDAIQEGIDIASGGDTVLVKDGTYTGTGNRDMDFHGKAITVTSENGAENCVINCQGSASDYHRGFNFHSGEDKDSVLKGFTINNGDNENGGGIRCKDSSPSICNSIISDCFSRDGHGGGLYFDQSSAVINNCVIANNRTGSFFINCFGGGLYCQYSDLTINYCTISDNLRTDRGLGAYFNHSDGSINHCLIVSNNAYGDYGGGLYLKSSSPMLTNCLFLNNSVGEYGGGLYLNSSSPILINCTLLGNSCGWGNGDGIYCNAGSSAQITNSILWGDVVQIYIIPGGTVTVSFSDVLHSGVYPGTGNINADPIFSAGPGGECYLSQISAGQGLDSPCLDAGNGDLGGLLPEIFLIHTTRTDHVLDNNVMDMGFHYPVVGVARAGGPYSGNKGDEIFFDASHSFDPYGDIIGYRWDWEDDGSWDTSWLSDPTTTHVYDKRFYGHARLQVKDDDNYTSIDFARVSISYVQGNLWLEEVSTKPQIQSKE
jgi:hypothetical protein